MADPLGAELARAVEALEAAIVDATHDLGDVLEDLDVVYMNSIALLGDSYRELDSRASASARTPRCKRRAPS